MSVHVTGRVRLDLRGVDDVAASRRVQGLEYAPAGAEVAVQVDAGQHYPPAWLQLHSIAARLSVTVECDDPATISRWITAAREAVTPW